MRKQIDFSELNFEGLKMMRSQIALATAGYGTTRLQNTRASAGLGALVLVAALSPIFVVCGFMLAQIFGYAGY